jgi:flavin-dependent dehydrogenase
MNIGIVGCGINGAFLAWKLSKGNNVEVFERNGAICDTPCSELISERIWKYFPRKSEFILNEIEELIIHFPKREVKLKFFPKMVVVDRKQLTNYVINEAVKNGAKISLNSDVKKIFLMRGKKPQMSVSGGVREFDYLIGCDGYNSIVRRSIGIKDPLCILGIYTRVKKKPKRNVIDVYPLDNGISWTIPRKNEIEYGVYERVDLAKDEFDKFCKRMNVKPGLIESKMIPSRLTPMHKGRVVLCGDAMGLTKPWSYGGIIWGLIADEILLKTFPNFDMYEEKVRKYFAPKIFYSKLALLSGKTIGFKMPSLAPKELWIDSDLVY